VFHPGLVTLFSLRLASLVIISALVRSIYPRLDFFFFANHQLWSWTLFGLFLLIILPTDPSFFLWIRHIPIIVVVVIHLTTTNNDTQHTSCPPPHQMRTIAARTSRRVVSRLFASVNPIHLDTQRSTQPLPTHQSIQIRTTTTTTLLQKRNLGGGREERDAAAPPCFFNLGY
jgi:hypothetical protein